MHRCLQLAVLAKGNVAPNPMVGAVLVYNNKIIGEGYHQKYGSPHAEVNCINSVSLPHKKYIPDATLYVSLEPCNHFGKTPPCTLFILQHNIKHVVLGCRDSFSLVNGAGIKTLLEAGVLVKTGVLEKECMELNKAFFTTVNKNRPYIILKWAATANGFIGSNTDEKLLISNALSNRLVHQLRSQTAAILVGTNTALKDNPSLSNRLSSGKQPIRLVIDKELVLPADYNLLDGTQDTIVFNYLVDKKEGKTVFHKLKRNDSFIEQLLAACFILKIQSILVEGGAKTLQCFIDNDLWDEAIQITNETLIVDSGVKAPILTKASLQKMDTLLNDSIHYYTPKQKSLL